MSDTEGSPTPQRSGGAGDSSGGLGQGLSSVIGLKRPGGLSDGPNARSKSVTVADGEETFGVSLPFMRACELCADVGQVLNRHPAETSSRKSPKSGPSASPGRQATDQADGGAPSTLRGSFRVGVSEDKNKKCRRTMEDAHSFVYDFAGIRGQGYFAVFDGHAGKHAAEWCGQHFHKVSSGS